MVKKIINCSYGEVEVRNSVFDINGTDLVEGIEIKGDDIGLIEIYGYYHIDDMSNEEIENLIKDYQ